MSRLRAFLFAASMVVAAFVLPMGSELLGMDIAGRIWSAGRLTLPLLAQAGHALAAGAVARRRLGGARRRAAVPAMGARGPRFLRRGPERVGC